MESLVSIQRKDYAEEAIGKRCDLLLMTALPGRKRGQSVELRQSCNECPLSDNRRKVSSKAIWEEPAIQVEF